jgi:S-DNA-T family DNA segregation ATPase FtsK/SpoIIIE
LWKFKGYNEFNMARRKKDRRGRPRKNKFGIKRKTVLSVFQIASLAVAGLILISFSRRGVMLIQLNDLLMAYFSWTTIFLPFIFLSFGFFLSRMRFSLSQPNVFIGAALFFVSILSLGRAGLIGKYAWEAVVALITVPGGFIVLLGTSLVGLVILFNTSLEAVLALIGDFLRQVRKYLLGEASLQPNFGLSSRKAIKVLGGGTGQKEAKSGSGAREELAPKLVSNVPGEQKVWKYPSLSLLEDVESGKADRGDIKANASVIEKTLESFGVTAKVVEVNLGPAVTQYALEVALGTKLSKITALERDMALALAAPTGTIRIEAPIPGRSLVGIELPNRQPEFVPLKKLLEADVLRDSKDNLAVALGLDVSGKPIVADVSDMPHVLIAGQTGSGKSVCINAFLTCLLFRNAPSEVKLILVDPKRVELTQYNDVPHLLTPVIIEPEKVVSALRWVMSEMDRRYKLFAQAGARNIDAYNEMSGFQALPYIVVVVDELADIMLFAPAEVEDSITRIAQMSRATGIHMILATQRPSVDIITGLIKANVPCRIAFAVSSQVDSRVILDTQGAEKLLGRGDMLYLPPEQAKPMRIQGAYISDKGILSLVAYLKNQGVKPQYTEEVTEMPKAGAISAGGVGEVDDLFRQAVETVCMHDKASASLLQRRLSIGYARAARILDQLEESGVVGPADGAKPREVLIKNPEEVLGQAS